MKTHMNNTKSIQPYINYDGKVSYNNHQHIMHTQKIKPIVQTHHKTEIKIANNNKKQLNQQPLKYVNILNHNLIQNKYKSTIDNKISTYQSNKKILKNKFKKYPKENFIHQQHLRQLSSQKQRVKYCKSFSQRKKDNTDPIVNPTYFMRDPHSTQSVTIQKYRNKVIKKNRPPSGRPASAANPTQKQIQAKIYSQSKNHQAEIPIYSCYGAIPNLSCKTNNKPKTAGQSRNAANKKLHDDDLPQCSFKAILNHIVNNKMYKEADIKVLYVRLCHKYGENDVDKIWQPLMEQLER